MVKKNKKTSAGRRARPPLARMLRLHEELCAGRFPNCRKLAESLEVSAKTIQRDLDFMRDQLGLPLDYHPQRFGFYYTEQVRAFPTVQVSEGELLALFVAQKAMGPYRGTAFEKPLQAAFKKLTESLPDEVSFTAGDMEAFYSFKATGAPVADLHRFELVSRALRESRRLRFDYKKLRGQQAEPRRVEPYHLACVDNQWYLFAQDLDRGSLRTFVLARMGVVEILKETFRRPRNFSPERLLAGSFGVFSASEKTYHVRIAFDVFASQLVRERVWHSTQKIHEKKDGTLVLEMTLSSLPEVERWILSWGGHARALGPGVLVKSLQNQIAEMCASYKGSATKSNYVLLLRK